MPSASDISRTIEPGSLDYGNRQVVANRLQETIPALQGGSVPSAPAPGAPAPGGPQDPIARLLSGGYSSDLPPTDGLSVGPGAGPASTGVGIASSPLIEKLRLIATEASSPLLRTYARASLRREILKSV
jgi:hypothetical protein